MLGLAEPAKPDEAQHSWLGGITVTVWLCSPLTCRNQHQGAASSLPCLGGREGGDQSYYYNIVSNTEDNQPIKQNTRNQSIIRSIIKIMHNQNHRVVVL